MKKFLLMVFIAIDLFIIVGAGRVLVERLRPQTIPVGFSNDKFPLRSISTPTPRLPSPAVQTPVAAPAPVSLAPAASSTRKILFSYRNSKAKKVMIRADFTGWKAEPMQTDKRNTWRYTAELEPGEYAYCFSIDGKSLRDPANKRTKKVGTTVVSTVVIAAPSSVPTR